MPDFAAELFMGLVLVGVGWWTVYGRGSRVRRGPDDAQLTVGQRAYRSNLRLTGWVLIALGAIIAVGSVF